MLEAVLNRKYKYVELQEIAASQEEHQSVEKLIQSPTSASEYKILAKVADLPSGKSQHCHVHWDSKTLPQAHHNAQ